MSLPAAAADRRRRPLADAVDGEDRGLVERRRVERAGRVRQVVLGIEDGVARRAQLARDARASRRRMNSFSLIQTGIAVTKLAQAAGANA